MSLFQYSTFGSILTIGAIVGATLSGRIADYVGRRLVSQRQITLSFSFSGTVVHFGLNFSFFHEGHGFLGGFLHLGISYHSILKGLPLISSHISQIEVYGYPRFFIN